VARGRAHAPEREPVFSPLCDDTYAIGLETIYEGYLCHHGRPRLFAPADDELALLLGDYLYAHGLVRIAATGSVDAVAELAELISVCSRLRAESEDGDAEAWLAAPSRSGRSPPDDAPPSGRSPRIRARVRGRVAPCSRSLSGSPRTPRRRQEGDPRRC
jgi:hypothetical protein